MLLSHSLYVHCGNRLLSDRGYPFVVSEPTAILVASKLFQTLDVWCRLFDTG